MKKLMVLVAAMALVAMVSGISFADDENEIVKRHEAWMKKVVAAQNVHKAKVEVAVDVKAETKAEATKGKDKINMNKESTIKVSKVRIYDAAGQIQEETVYNKPVKIDTLNAVIHLGIDEGRVEYFDEKGRLAVAYYIREGRLDYSVSYVYDGKKEALDRGTGIKEEPRYESDVDSGSEIVGNVSYGGKEGLYTLRNEITKEISVSNSKEGIKAFDHQPSLQEQIEAHGPLTPEEMASAEARLAQDRVAHNGAGSNGLTLVNGSISQRQIPVYADSVAFQAELPLQRPNQPAVGSNGVSAGFSMVSEMVRSDNVKDITAPKIRK